MTDQHQPRFLLRWTDFQANLVQSFRNLKSDRSFADVTIAAEGQNCKSHKVVLSACSPFFREILNANPSRHPIIVLNDVSFSHLQSILEFMYSGEVTIPEQGLAAFLATAEKLQVKGLVQRRYTQQQ